MDKCIENVLEFLLNQERATVTFSQARYKSRIRKLAEQHPDECQIVAENKDGSLLAHIPTRWIRITPPAVQNISEEERKSRGERLKNVREAITGTRETGQFPSETSLGYKLPFEE